MIPKLDRWQWEKPFDALSWALCLKNRRAARALLEKREGLTWMEASEYAPLTLRWAPDLLALILDKVPEGEEELFCVREFLYPGGGRITKVDNSLLTAAAALDDLAAVGLLLARGNCELDGYELHRNIHLSPHYHQLGRLRSNTSLLGLNKVWLQEAPAGEEGRYSMAGLDVASPLSAAVFCGSQRCTLRLLPEYKGELSLDLRRALTRTELPEDRGYRAAVAAVTARLGKDLAELLDPEDFLDRRQPLFRECLKCHGGRVDPAMIQCLISQGRKKKWAQEALRWVKPQLLSGVLLDLIRRNGGLRSDFRPELRELQYIFDMPRLKLVLDRNAVPPDADSETLLRYLDRAQVVGELPEGELSGLAVNLLDHILKLTAKTPRAGLTALPASINSKALAVLMEEDHELILEYLLGEAKRLRTERDACTVVNLLMSLMGIQWEVNYEL